MTSAFNASYFRMLSEQLEEITTQEVSEANPAPLDEPEDQKNIDKNMTDIMTKEKKPVKLSGSINVRSLAGDLGIENINLFITAFNLLKKGQMPTSQQQIRELAVAFDKLISVDDPVKISRILSKLRQIHRAKD